MFKPFTQAIVHDPDARAWHVYAEPVAVHACRDLEAVAQTLTAVESAVEAHGLYAVGFVTYEAARAFDDTFAAHEPGRLPLVAFTLYRRREETPPPSGNGTGILWQDTESEAQYRSGYATLKAAIGAGDVYQVNYTTRLQARCDDPHALFDAICAGARHGAYLEHPDFAVISASPELFFALSGANLTTMPMKGTSPRGATLEEDRTAGAQLGASRKDRAENLMITDMVRNDLGRVAEPGSVKVPELFSVSAHPRVWQMTSTVTAQTTTDLASLFAALFPAASITGAPKHASMQFIRDLEPGARELYTGTIGVLAPKRRYRFNVAIRTAWVDRESHVAEYGVGGGIVWDSNVDAELEERRDKAKILEPLPAFELLETMRVEAGRVALLDAHLARLTRSAELFGFHLDHPRVIETIEAATAQLDSGAHRLRLTLDAKGSVGVTVEILPTDGPWQPVALAATAVSVSDMLLYHKTTHRQIYEQAAAEVPATCEALLFNEHGLITESAIANVVYEMQGERFTPPVSDGLLPGTLRGQLVAAGEVQERSLAISELERIEGLYLVNALRGWRRARLVDYDASASGWRR